MKKIQLKILRLQPGHLSSSYVLILEEVEGKRKLFITIGLMEAQAIALELEKIEPLRPLTHDLFKSFALAFNLHIKEVLIHKIENNVFHSLLLVTDGTREQEVDSRTSDAVALALRFNCPLYTYDELMDEAENKLRTYQVEQTEETEEGDEHDEADEEEDETEALLRKASKKEKEPEVKPPPDDDLLHYPLAKLKKMLSVAIADEDYILAARIRDAIKKFE
jgi:bifunctional DNase/RNase